MEPPVVDRLKLAVKFQNFGGLESVKVFYVNGLSRGYSVVLCLFQHFFKPTQFQGEKSPLLGETFISQKFAKEQY